MTDISYGSANTFDATNISDVSVAALDSTHFVISYRKASTAGGTIVGSISGTTISYGSENGFVGTTVEDTSVAALDSTHFVVAYKNNSGKGSAIVGLTDGGTTISSFGSAVEFNAAATADPKVTALDSTHFAIAYTDVSDSSHGTAVVGVTSGTTISSYGTPVEYDTANSVWTSIATLDSTHFVVCYTENTVAGAGTAIVAVTSGTTISSFGTGVEYNTVSTNANSVAVLDSTHFVVAYRDDGGDGYGAARIGVTSGTTISSFGTENIFNSASTANVGVAALDSTHFAVSYRDAGNSNYGTTIVGESSGTTISSYGSEFVYNEATTTFIEVSSLDSETFVISYNDNSTNGDGIIGSIASATSTGFFAMF